MKALREIALVACLAAIGCSWLHNAPASQVVSDTIDCTAPTVMRSVIDAFPAVLSILTGSDKGQALSELGHLAATIGEDVVICTVQAIQKDYSPASQPMISLEHANVLDNAAAYLAGKPPVKGF